MMPTGNWPVVSHETLTWERGPSLGSSRRSQLAHRGSYQAAVPGQIFQHTPTVTAETAALADEMVIHLARFDAKAGNYLLPFAALLLRSEASGSSQIENLTATPAAILKAEIGIGETPNARLIIANQRALSSAITESSEITFNSILRMHSLLMADTHPGIAGKLREHQGWIGGTSLGPHNAAYVAPQASRVPALLEDWIRFANRIDLPALIQVAVAHAQFETIHPFADGNGRTGRALIQSMLKRLGVMENIAIPISVGLLQNREQYFAALIKYRDGELDPIVVSLAQAIDSAVAFGYQLVDDIEAIHSQWVEVLLVRSDSSAPRLLDYLVKQPIINSADVVRELGLTPRTGLIAIEKLVELGILEQVGGGARNRVWQAPEILHVLEKHAARLKRS